MYKQILTIIFLLFYTIVNSQEVHRKKPVYVNSKKIGLLYEQAEISQCKGCYVLDTIKVFDKFLVIKNEAILLGVNTKNGTKNHFSTLYNFEVKIKNKDFIIEFDNSISSSAGEIYIKKVNTNIILYKILAYSHSSTNIAIAKNDLRSFPSTYICIQNTNINVFKRILDFNLLSQPQENADCFHCPIKYSTAECLKIRKSKQKIKWN
jgi:hypothetical protein